MFYHGRRMSIAIHRGTGHVAGHHRPAVGGDLGIEAVDRSVGR